MLYALMGPCSVEVRDVGLEDPIQLLFTQNEQVIKTLSPDTLPKKRSPYALARGARYGVFNTLMPELLATRAKSGPNLLSLSRIKNLGACPKGVASRSGSSNPGIGRMAGYPNMEHFPALQFNEEEGKERTEEQVSDW